MTLYLLITRQSHNPTKANRHSKWSQPETVRHPGIIGNGHIAASRPISSASVIISPPKNTAPTDSVTGRSFLHRRTTVCNTFSRRERPSASYNTSCALRLWNPVISLSQALCKHFCVARGKKINRPTRSMGLVGVRSTRPKPTWKTLAFFSSPFPPQAHKASSIKVTSNKDITFLWYFPLFHAIPYSYLLYKLSRSCQGRGPYT